MKQRIHLTLSGVALETLDKLAVDARRSRSGMVEDLILHRAWRSISYDQLLEFRESEVASGESEPGSEGPALQPLQKDTTEKTAPPSGPKVKEMRGGDWDHG